MPQLITIGETMAAFTPDSVGALRYVQNFGIRTAGAESNVAVGLAKLGLEAAWVSRLGTDEFGCFIRNQLRAEGVDCSRVIYDPDHRTGIMFKETGVGETKVFYYRENSAASHLCPEDVTPALLEGVKILHMSGITPVLSESCLAMTKAAFALAKEQGVAISFDPNIRRKLWKGQDYAPLIRDLTLQSQIVLLGLDEAEVQRRVREAAAFVGLSDELLEKSPFELSGGQKRRVAIAGVMAMHPRVLVLDEPAAGLDPEGRDTILSQIKDYHEKTGITVLLVSHSMEDIAKYANRVLVMHRAKIAMYDTVENVFARAQELLELGLSVPQVTQIFLKLRQMGLDIPADVYTIPYAVKTIQKALAAKQGGGANA